MFQGYFKGISDIFQVSVKCGFKDVFEAGFKVFFRWVTYYFKGGSRVVQKVF